MRVDTFTCLLRTDYGLTFILMQFIIWFTVYLFRILENGVLESGFKLSSKTLILDKELNIRTYANKLILNLFMIPNLNVDVTIHY